MIFLDTSAIYALADQADPNHRIALRAFSRLIGEGEEVLVHSYVLAEAAALLQRRLGLESALRFLEQAQGFEVQWIGPQEHTLAVGLLRDRGRRGLSLVDCASFAVMQSRGVREALAFDADFEVEGMALYRA